MPDEIITDLIQIQRATVAKEDENLAFRTFVKLEVELSDRQLNTLVSDTTAQVWQHVDCRSCANCCRVRQPVFSRAEAERIAAYLGLTLADIRERYLKSDAETGKYITQSLPCPFLDGNLCAIYEVRPAVCANYPHLHRNFRSRLWQAIDNAETCPIVYNVVEHLKTTLGFVPPAGE
ncbi:MAG: YkgJ family cysteine cluster protein [Candidatus Tectomicrobia bacterium]|uniref:YkgJ family cysteine cluster protein n=1 Tax=Tectimicrobiota bacterium TaxID=2528274 RepID=A0A937VWQ4_UNCTE|nr:YkgJ family cysteine cluster protein [Candidatus Tectomicrobia bacterium]